MFDLARGLLLLLRQHCVLILDVKIKLVGICDAVYGWLIRLLQEINDFQEDFQNGMVLLEANRSSLYSINFKHMLLKVTCVEALLQNIDEVTCHMLFSFSLKLTQSEFAKWRPRPREFSHDDRGGKWCENWRGKRFQEFSSRIHGISHDQQKQW